MNGLKGYYSKSEASRVLGIPYTSLLKIIRDLGIASTRIGPVDLLTQEDVRRIAEHRGVEPPCLSCAS